MKYNPQNLEETQRIAQDFAEKLSPLEDGALVVGLYGELGAGKTSFTQAVAKKLGVKDVITSPTFVIEKIYDLEGQKFSKLIHIDAYRLEKSEELLKLGWRDITADKNNLILIEWPERVADIIVKHMKVSLRTLDSGEAREINIEELKW